MRCDPISGWTDIWCGWWAIDRTIVALDLLLGVVFLAILISWRLEDRAAKKKDRS